MVLREKTMKNRTCNELEKEYVVQPGDTLWDIARRFYGTGMRYAEIEEEKAGVLFGHEYLITGTVLKIRQRQPCSESIRCFV